MNRAFVWVLLLTPLAAQTPPAGGRGGTGPSPAPTPAPAAAPAPLPSNDEVLKGIDDLEWRMQISDIADFDKVAYTSLPPRHNPNPTAPGAGNPLIVYAYTFIPKKLDRTRKQPLLVLIHGGV